MLFWAILTLLVAVAAAALTIPLARRYDAGKSASNMSMLKGQLADLERQVAQGEVTEDAAHDLQVEIKRRMLIEGKATEKWAPLSFRTRAGTGVAVAALVAAAAVGLYTFLGAPSLAELRGAETAPAPDDGAAAPAQLADTIAELKKKLALTPNDADGWQLLAETTFQAQRYDESADAYARAQALKPGDAALASAHGEALVMAASGQVTPAAKTAFGVALKQSPDDVRARYYLALGKDQEGETRAAIDDWIGILNQSAEDAPWVPLVQRTVEQRAKAANINIDGRIHLKRPGPTEEQVRALEQLPAEEREAMIRGMVDRLAARLKANPENPEGWLQLIEARVTLKDKAGADAALADARRVYQKNPEMTERLDTLAHRLGLAAS